MHQSSFKDLFSKQANDYAKFRPTYPKELFDYLNSLTAEKNIAWDCGTGNGQAALELAKTFSSVMATDPSEKQISNAPAHPQIHYSVASAEDFNSIESQGKINLITVAQAFHWFKHERFAEIVKKLAAPDAYLVVWSYAISSVTPEVDRAVHHLYEDILHDYWESERRLVEDGYKSIAMPFKEIAPPVIAMKAEWSLEHFTGYLSTWSALQKYISINGQNPLETEYEKIKEAWGDCETRTVSWPLNIRVWKIFNEK
jgi:hypothetical protein